MITRRGIITGLASLVAAPAIVRAASLMPIKAPPLLSCSEITWVAGPGGPYHGAVLFYETPFIWDFGEGITIRHGETFVANFKDRTLEIR